jgi:phosphoesterase RecJ-like protein
MDKNVCIKNYFKPEQVEYVRKLVDEHHTFLLTTHVHPDGDGLGSELCLFYWLKKLGKEVFILNTSPIPDLYRFLDPKEIINTYDRSIHQSLLSKIDVCFVVDIGDWERLRKVGKDLKELRKKSNNVPKVVCIDHHPFENEIGDFDIIYPDASSTGEIVYLLFDALKMPIDIKMADAIYTAILTDTGSFRFSNTTMNCHYIAGLLINLGVDHRAIYKQVYEKEPLSKMKLLSELLNNLHFECDQHIVWYSITQEMLKRYEIEPYEIEGVSDFPRRIQGVHVSILFMEIKDSLTKISLRSTGEIPINGLAQMFGGGGHPYASGALVKKPLEVVVGEVMSEVCQYYQKNCKFNVVGEHR